MKNIKNFLKKKEAEWKFKSGVISGGHKLSDDKQSNNSQQSTSYSNIASVPERKTGPDRKVAEAALARLQGNTTGSANVQRSQGQNLGQKSTLHDLINEEKKLIQQEAKIKDELEERKQKALLEEQNSAVRINPLKRFDESQLFRCPVLFPETEDVFSMKDLNSRIKCHIFDNFTDDSIMRSAMILFNCNRNLLGYNDQLQNCLDILKKITFNLQNASNEEEFKKFSKIRKSKIEKNVLSLDGALDFLFAIGFTIDSNDSDWLIFTESFEDVSSKMIRIGELLSQPQIFDVILDRQVQTVEQKTSDNDNNDDVQITGSDIKRLHQGLERQREINDMFVSKTTKNKLISGTGLTEYKNIFTVLRFKLPIADDVETIQANFRSKETFSDVRKWFYENFIEFFDGKKYYL